MAESSEVSLLHDEGTATTSAPARTRGPRLASSMRDTEGLLREMEQLTSQGGNDDQCSRVAAQLCARAYDVDAAAVLKMVRGVGTLARQPSRRTETCKQELLRATDQLLQSLIARLSDARLDLLTEIVETMAEVVVGTQDFLDMLLALMLARHHKDCQELTSLSALRVAIALGRVSTSSLRLRPKGIGGASTSTNSKVLDILQKRLLSGLNELAPEALARMDDYYVTRLCDDALRRAIVFRMAELQLGLKEETKQHLSTVLRLQETLRRELTDAFVFTLPRPAKLYFEQLRTLNLKDTAPWSLGDFSRPPQSYR